MNCSFNTCLEIVFMTSGDCEPHKNLVQVFTHGRLLLTD